MNVLTGICGGISAYKICELIRLLKSKNINVKVVMTENACKFITPLTFQTLSNNKVYTDMFELSKEISIEHIELAKWADCIIIAPATANTISKISLGIADNLLTTLVLSRRCPTIIAPAMNVAMYNNPTFQINLNKIKDYGFYICEPEEGDLACGDKGLGRLMEVEKILNLALSILDRRKKFKGKKFIITAGPTRERVDSVRFISNYSSGKMGYSIAQEAVFEGAEVVLISGVVNLSPPFGCKLKKIESAKDMYESIMEDFNTADVLIMSAAVADFIPKTLHKHKIKKSDNGLILKLKNNIDILYEISKIKKNKLLIGFAAESEDLILNAKEKLKKKNLDMVIANDITNDVFGSDYNEVKIIYKNGKVVELERNTKIKVAQEIMKRIGELL